MIEIPVYKSPSKVYHLNPHYFLRVLWELKEYAAEEKRRITGLDPSMRLYYPTVFRREYRRADIRTSSVDTQGKRSIFYAAGLILTNDGRLIFMVNPGSGLLLNPSGLERIAEMYQKQ